MDFHRFTEKSQEVLQNAQALAARRNHQGVDVEHLLATLLEEHKGLAAALGRKLLAGDIHEHSRVVVDWDGTNLTFTPYPVAEAA